MIGDDDLSILENGDWDEEAVFTVGAGTVTVKGWRTLPTQQVNVLTNEVEASNPTFQTRSSGVSTVRNKDSVVIGGVTYTVQRIEQIGDGRCLVHLKT